MALAAREDGKAVGRVMTTAGLAWATLSSPVGPLAVACSEAGVARVRFRSSPGGQPAQGARGAGTDLLTAARDQLCEYFAGQRRDFDVPIDWAGISASQRQVLTVLFESVGYGETVTYGGLAQRAVTGPDGISLPARAIGRIIGVQPGPGDRALPSRGGREWPAIFSRSS